MGLALGFLMVCCSPPVEQAPPIRIGLLCPLSGELALDAHVNLAGAELAVKEANRAGGIDVGGHRRKVELLVEDTENVAEIAVQKAQRLINQEDVAAMIGPFSSSTAIPVAAVAESAGMIMISPTASNPQVTAGKRYVFRSCFSDAFQGKALARFAREDLGALTAAVLYDVTNAYSKGLAEIFKQELDESGVAVLSFESYVRDVQDFTPQLTRIRDLSPAVLFLPNFSDSVRLQAQQAKQLGITATLLGSDLWNSSELSGVAELEGAFNSEHWHPDAANAEAQAFREAFQAANGPALDFQSAALAYDAFGLLFRAIEDQGSFASDRVRAGLVNLEGYRGVTGTISFDTTGDPIKDAAILRIQNGEPVLYKEIRR